MDTPPKWDLAGFFLEDQLTQLIARIRTRPYEQAEGWEGVTEDLFALSDRSAEEADRVSRHLAHERSLPSEISSDAAFLILLRVQCALDFVGMIFPPKSVQSPFGDVPAGWSEPMLLEWLLVDLWRRRFDHWLKLHAIGLCGPFSFYGLRPVDSAEES